MTYEAFRHLMRSLGASPTSAEGMLYRGCVVTATYDCLTATTVVKVAKQWNDALVYRYISIEDRTDGSAEKLLGGLGKAVAEINCEINMMMDKRDHALQQLKMCSDRLEHQKAAPPEVTRKAAEMASVYDKQAYFYGAGWATSSTTSSSNIVITTPEVFITAGTPAPSVTARRKSRFSEHGSVLEILRRAHNEWVRDLRF